LAVRLDINVRGVDKLGGGGPAAALDPTRILKTQERLMRRQLQVVRLMARGMRDMGQQMERLVKLTERGFTGAFRKAEQAGTQMVRRTGQRMRDSVRTIERQQIIMAKRVERELIIAYARAERRALATVTTRPPINTARTHIIFCWNSAHTQRLRPATDQHSARKH